MRQPAGTAYLCGTGPPVELFLMGAAGGVRRFASHCDFEQLEADTAKLLDALPL